MRFPKSQRRGVTLVEMILVVGIAGLIVSLTFPMFISGLETYRLSGATESVAAFLNSAVSQAERREQPVEIVVSLKDNVLLSGPPERRLALPDGVTLEAVFPKLPVESSEPRRFLLLPGAAAPRMGIQIHTRSARRLVSLDPITGVPRIEPGVAQ